MTPNGRVSMASHIERRKFLATLGGATAAWPLAARAQQAERMRRIGVLMNLAAEDAEGQARLAAFLHGLQEAGWAVGRNVRVDIRWGASDVDRIRKHAADLVALAPNVILASTGQVMAVVQQATRPPRIVFTAVPDPVASGDADTLARPGGNITGFSSAEFGMSTKWLELLKEIAPSVTRVGVFHAAANIGGLPQFAAIQAVAPPLGVEVITIGMRDAGEIERIVAGVARSSNGGLIVTRIIETIAQRDLIVALAARYRLPAVYPLRLFVSGGGLVSFGPCVVDPHRRAAGYVDRILRGDKPADLPVQAPTKYETVLNLKTAKALGLELPATVLARADEVIE